ncbi:prohibitin family protein [Desulfovibrio inopinatus]|uniref:prohibitin family protein n=1 Tax=Desulfovibrio inopinatus TaxID=102109 RepID=UPI000400E6D4|nr:prohibitin family protein [Desulfovibrio inopinatus]
MNPLTFFRQHKIISISFVFVMLFLFVYLSPLMFVYIYPGQAGVYFNALAQEPLADDIYREGLYMIAPWNKMYVYTVTKQKRTLQVDALTNNGLYVSMSVSAIFHPQPEGLKELVRHIGPNFTDNILVPVIYSATRQVIGKYLPEALYTSARTELQRDILAEAKKELDGQPFAFEDLVIEKLELPKAINAAIEDKLKRQQEALSYQYLLQLASDEAKRRRIEAEGIKQYQEIVGSNLSPNLLRWLEIKAMSDVSRSDNSKVVVIGSPENMPLVLDAGGGK